jgi:hypothetical protein
MRAHTSCDAFSAEHVIQTRQQSVSAYDNKQYAAIQLLGLSEVLFTSFDLI